MRRRRFGVSQVEFADFTLSDCQCAVYDPRDLPSLIGDGIGRRLPELLAPCDYVRFDKLASPDPVLRALFPRVRLSAMRTSTYPAVLGSEWMAWRAQRVDRQFARYLDRKRRRLNRLGNTRFALVEEEAELRRVFQCIRRFRAQRFRKLRARDLTARDSIFDFYQQVAIEGAATQGACTFCLYVDEEPASIVFGLRNDYSFAMIMAAFDSDYGSLSVGLLGLEDSLRSCMKIGISVYDFAFGDHAYKVQLGAEKVPMLEFRAPLTARGSVCVVALDIARELKGWARSLAKRDAQWGRPRTRESRAG